jgi:hypothetical protein
MGHERVQQAMRRLAIMESTPDLGPLLGRDVRERECLCEALAHYVLVVASPQDQGRERECLCEALARDYIPIQVDLNDESDKKSKCDAELWINWNLDGYEGDSPDGEPADAADSK